ncbi:MAG: molybdopterin-binding protein [Roseiflexaceae bacterium]|nr:molybdopterin-binding protein [Roseiflexaceae bacterium]
MYQTTLSPEQAVGHILRHNIADQQGRKALHKGRKIGAGDVATLRELGVEAVPVAVFEPGDVHEDEAARQVAAAIMGAHVRASAPAASRVNLFAEAAGVVQIDAAGLLRMNGIDGVTVATLRSHTRAAAGARLATIKIIPFAIPQAALAEVAAIGQAHTPIVALRPLHSQRVAVVLVGSGAARERIADGVYPAIEQRVAELGSYVQTPRYAAADEYVVAAAILAALEANPALIIVAGETSIMDRDDVTPRAIRLAGGRIEHYGAPVEPGNLLLLAYLERAGKTVAILGAPGCVRSRNVNIVDVLLPRLLTGELVTRSDIIELGHGGLL